MSSMSARRILPWAALGLGVTFLALQFVPVDRINPPVEMNVDAPPEVESILRNSCYDCHSHETNWPWYSSIAPLSWWIADHVEHGRKDLNFSCWPTFDFVEQGTALEDIEEQITKDEMPLRSYRILHPEARLTDDDRKILLDWARSRP
jgi:hypothetical protein